MMANIQSHEGTARAPLRVWPGVVAVVLQWVAWIVVPLVAPAAALYGMFAALACGGVIVVWWLFFSRARWSERVGAIGLMVIAVWATTFLVHPSIANGMMGMMLPLYAIPALSLALVAWAVASRGLAGGLRYASMVGAILIACGAFTLIRTGGITGEGDSDLHWRWTPSPEERLLAHAGNAVPARAPIEPAAPPVSMPAPVATAETPSPAARSDSADDDTPASAPAAAAATIDPGETGATPVAALPDPGMSATTAEWPGFRGPHRDSVIRGMRIETNWSRTPPVEVWRRPVGPGWSSFAVRGDLVYTQEQRGDDELVSCYRLSTGEPVWQHRDGVRFWESNGGAGPRATPTIDRDRVFTFGGTGIVNALDAATGAVVWSRQAATDTGVAVPDWGFASSPLVVDDLVVIAASGRLVAYDRAGGQVRWLGPAGGAGYSSPHLVSVDGVAQILLLRGSRTISVSPADGTLLWEHVWQPGVGIVQPATLAGGDLLIVTGDGMGGVGMRRVTVAHGAAGWHSEARWTSRGLKPYFNDFVVHEGHAYGFDGSILAAIDLEDGARAWKGGRYGHGQMVLLPEQDVLLVLSEDGELALVSATPDRFTELARIPALDGKTWNHPVLIGDLVLIRNGQEMAAFRLPREGR